MLAPTQYSKLPLPDDQVEFLVNVHPKLGDLYSQSRSDRHLNAQVMLLRLYATGAALINEGTAYRQHQSAKTMSAEEWVLKNRPFALEQNRQTLLVLYHKIPTYIEDTRCRHGELINPFHLVFLVKVALDHMGSQEIYELYQHIGVESSCLTTGTSVTLPNGSRVLSDTAASHLLHMYIEDNLSKFPFIPDDRKCYFGKKLHLYETLARRGNRDKVTEINTLPLADNIHATLNQEISVQRQQKPAVHAVQSNPAAASLPFLGKKRRKENTSDQTPKRNNTETESKTLGC